MLPHELAARYIVPPMKALVAHVLREKGLGQERIARLLGVSQPMVSRYLRRKRSEVLRELEEAGALGDEASSVAAVLASRLLQGDYRGYISLFTSYINTLLVRGSLCQLHQRLDPMVPRDCSICSSLFQPGSDPLVLEVEEAVRLFSSAPGAEQLVPNVGSNIVAAAPHASSLQETVGLTGALVRAGDKVVAVGNPAYGGSRHTAQVLLLAKKRRPGIRAVAVIAHSRSCIERLREKGLHVIETGPHRSPERLLEEIAEVLSKTGGPVDAVADLGGQGLEPVIYVFGPNALEAVERALTCLPPRAAEPRAIPRQERALGDRGLLQAGRVA